MSKVRREVVVVGFGMSRNLGSWGNGEKTGGIEIGTCLCDNSPFKPFNPQNSILQ